MASEDEQPIRRVYDNGDIEWKLPNGKRHRLEGPAIEWAGGKSRWAHNKRHRLDGPAIEWVDGTKAWYIEGQQLTEQQWTLEVCRRLRDGQ